MNPLDIFIITILCYCLIRGIFRGLIKELSSIIGVFAGFYAGYTYYPMLAKPLSKWISNVSYLNILSFVIIFCSILIAVSIISILIKYALNITFLGWFDRLCGLLFGAVKGILIVSALFFILTTFLPKGSPVIKESMVAPYVFVISENIAKVVPNDMKRQFNDKIKELKETWKIPS